MATSIRQVPEWLATASLRPQRLQRLLIIVTTLAGAAYLAWRPRSLYYQAPAALVGLWVFLRYPSLGPVAIIVSALVVRFSIGTGTQTSLHLALLLVPALLGLWVVKGLHRRSVRLAPSRVNAPLIGLAITAVVAFIAGNLTWNYFAQLAPVRSQVGATAIFLCTAGAVWLTANEIKDRRWLQAMVWVFVALGGVYITARLSQGALAAVLRLFPNGALGSVFWIWFVALTLGMALFNRDLWPGLRLLLLGAALATFYVAMTGEARSWASGWLPALAAAGVLVYLRWPRFSVAMGVIGGVGLLVAYPVVSDFLLEGNEYSLLTRTAAIEIVLQISRANPLLGVGPANYYFYTPLFPILGWYVNFNSHNQYVDLIAQVGYVGLFFFGWLAFELGRLAWRLRQTFADGFAQAYANICLAALAGMLIAGVLGDWLLPFVYNVGIAGFRASVIGWLFLGGLVALENMARRKAAEA